MRRRVKKRALSLITTARARGRSRRSIARRLHVAPQTLHDWKHADERGVLETARRGRPRTRESRTDRATVMAELAAHGGRIGQATLERRVPAVPRRRIRRIHGAYRRLHGHAVGRTTWTRPGVAWSMDYTELAEPVDGAMRWLLSIRDLGSSQRLAAQPVGHATDAAAADILGGLLSEHGAPLVIKSDNGAPFQGQRTMGLLDECGVAHMLSPPGTPEYNGAIEADIGGLKRRLTRITGDRPPISADVELARLELNAEIRTSDGKSADDRWIARTPITSTDRAAFQSALAVAQAEERHAITAAGTNPRRLSKRKRATVARRAIRRTLEARGELIITWRNATSSG